MNLTNGATMKQMIGYAAVALAMAFLAVVGIDYAFAMPDVYVSFSTNECVKVVNHDSAFFGSTNATCGDLPTRYNFIWAK